MQEGWSGMPEEHSKEGRLAGWAEPGTVNSSQRQPE